MFSQLEHAGLYLPAVTAENVRLTLKNLREPVVDFEPLLPTEK
jgi:hypothetical protein